MRCPGSVAGAAAAATWVGKIATAAIGKLGNGDHGNLMVFVSRQIKVQPRAA
jgi:hypothetical protein